MAGPIDKIVAEPDVAATCDVFENCDYIQLSVADGFSNDYGHVDPVIGKHAPTEIYPLIVDFLDEASAPEGASVE